MTHITRNNVLNGWWSQGRTRAAVLASTILAILDSAYTIVWIGERGLAGELNPIIRTFFEMGLGSAWWVANILVTFLAAAFLGSCITVFPSSTRLYPMLGLSLLATLRVLLALHHLLQFYNLLEVTWIVWPISIAIFLITRATLTGEAVLQWKSITSMFREIRSDLSTFLIVSRLGKPSPREAPPQPIRTVAPKTEGTIAALWNRRLMFWVIVIVLTPLLALSVIQLILGASGVLNLPSWMRRLGIVSEEQGRLFLVAVATIFLTIGVLVYGVAAVFEALSGENSKRRKRS